MDVLCAQSLRPVQETVDGVTLCRRQTVKKCGAEQSVQSLCQFRVVHDGDGLHVGKWLSLGFVLRGCVQRNLPILAQRKAIIAGIIIVEGERITDFSIAGCEWSKLLRTDAAENALECFNLRGCIIGGLLQKEAGCAGLGVPCAAACYFAAVKLRRPVEKFETGLRVLGREARVVPFLRDLGRRIRRAGEAHRAHERRERDDGEHRRGLGLPVLRDACDALLEAPFAAGHGRRAEQWVLRLVAHGHEREQRFAVGGALVRAERAERPLVAGQLAVLAREHRREPHERVEPVDGQAHAAQQRPEWVEVPRVRLLVREHEAQGVGALQRLFVQVNGGAQHTEQARRGQRGHEIDRIAAALDAVRCARLAQRAGEAQVGEKEPCAHAGHSGVPDVGERFGKRDGSVGRRHSVVFVGGGALRCVGRRRQRLTLRLLAGQKLCGAPLRAVLNVQHGGIQPLLHNGLHRLGGGEHIVRQCADVHRYEQPHEHQKPERVLHPARDGAAEQLPQRQQRKDQSRGSQKDLFHFVFPPACSKMAVSSSMSSCVSARPSTMALIIRPRLPP